MPVKGLIIMKKIFKLKGIENEASFEKIEKSVAKIRGVNEAALNIEKGTLSVIFDENIRKSINRSVSKAVHKHERKAEVLIRHKPKKKTDVDNHNDHEQEHEHDHEHCHCGHDHDHEHEHKHEHKHEHGHNHEHDHEHCHCGHDHDHEHEHEHKHDHGHNHDHAHDHEHGHCGHDHDHNHDHEHKEHSSGPKNKTGKNISEAVFRLDGLDCPHCASQIESELEKKEGIVYAEINLINQELKIGTVKGKNGDLLETAKKAVKKFEPGVDVIDDRNGEKDEKKASLAKKLTSEKAMYIRFGVGTALYAAGFAMSLSGKLDLAAYLPVLIASYIILGGDVVIGAVKNILSGRVFDEKFLMTVSTIGAFAIGEYPEAVAVMLFYQIGEFFQSLAVKRSRRSISDLMDIRPDSANLCKDGEITVVSPENVQVGDIIVVKPGEKIPLDGEIIEGETSLDTRALTGESVPRRAVTGDSVLSGCINETGAVKIKVTKAFGESTSSKILDLVENAAGRKAPTENFISVFARYYTPVVVILAVLLAVVPPLILHGGWTEWIRRCFVFLVISCPCALVISIPLTFFGGIGAASKKGVLVKGSNYLEALNYVDTIVFDKTGTLTKGVFKVTKLLPSDGVTENELLEYAAAAEKMSTHPIARSIAAQYGGNADNLDVTNYREIPGHGVSAEFEGKKLLAGSGKLMSENKVTYKPVNDYGTVVYVAAEEKLLGSIVIADEIKPTSAEAVSQLHELGVSRAVMLTGDNNDTAKAVAELTGMDEFYSELLPAQKVEKLENLFESSSDGGKIAFVGDGINDAPVLARADVGAAMGALGSDAAIEAADIVLMKDDPSSLADAIKIARYTKHIVTQNIVIVLAVKVIILALGALGLAGMWEAVFGDVGIMIIAVLNSMRILRK